MYNEFFRLHADPFRVNPDPRFLFLSESHQEALATLVYAVRERKGFIVLTGEVGTGKTTILNALLGKLEPGVQVAYLFNTSLETEDFFALLLEELGLEPIEPFRKSAALRRLNAHLIDRLREGEQTLLLVDEAQNLSVELLEEIRMLSNLETPQSKLLQIVLVGQPELAAKLERPELRQLRQRVELRHVIRPLNGVEMSSYVRERLVTAGHATGDVFTYSALCAVHEHSRGIPRVANVLCDNAMLLAFARGSQMVSAQMVQEAAKDLGLMGSRSHAEARTVRREKPQAPRGWLRRWWPARSTRTLEI